MLETGRLKLTEVEWWSQRELARWRRGRGRGRHCRPQTELSTFHPGQPDLPRWRQHVETLPIASDSHILAADHLNAQESVIGVAAVDHSVIGPTSRRNTL